MSTIKDVSKHSGLSLATISKYLNGGNVREENRQRIDEAVAALGFRVNRNARSLKTNRTMTVGVVMPTLSVPFFGSVISSLDQTLREAGYTSFVCSYDFDRDLELEKLRVLCNNNVDGIVLAAQYVSARELNEIRNDRGTEMPMVLVDRTISGFVWIVPFFREGPHVVLLAVGQCLRGRSGAKAHLGLELGELELGACAAWRL